MKVFFSTLSLLFLLSSSGNASTQNTPSTCEPALQRLRTSLKQYFNAPSNEIIAEIQSLLGQKKLRSCRAALSNLYAIESFKELTRLDLAGAKGYTGKEFRNQVLSLLESMDSKGLLRSFRKGKRRSDSVLGTYDCTRSEIKFDSRLSPLDLGSVIAHELDHLLRDKITFGLTWTESGLLEKFSLEEIIVIDEITANLMSGLSSIRYFKSSEKSFVGVNDLSLFYRDGPLKRMVDLSSLELPQDGHFSGLNETFYSVIALAEPFYLFLETVVQTYTKAYFPNYAFDLEKLTSGLKYWLAYDFPSSYRVMHSKGYSLSPLRDALSFISSSNANVFDDLDTLLKTPSKGCQVIQAAIDQGTLHLSSKRESEGVRTTEGVRTSKWVTDDEKR